MKKLLIIKTGNTLPSLLARRGDFEDWILTGLCLPAAQVCLADVSQGEPLPAPNEISGVVVTGSHTMVTEALPWSENTAAWLRAVVTAGTPLLGICYGHQLLAHALNGEVRDNPRGREYGTAQIHLTAAGQADPLLAGLEIPLRAQVCHTQTVTRLPDGAKLLAWSRNDRHQAFVVGERAWGVQFHPEFDRDIMGEYIRAYRQDLIAEGQDPEALLAQSEETSAASSILARFAQISVQGA